MPAARKSEEREKLDDPALEKASERHLKQKTDLINNNFLIDDMPACPPAQSSSPSSTLRRTDETNAMDAATEAD